MKQQNFNLKKEWKESLSYVKKSKNFIYIIIGVFVAFVLIGFFIPPPESVANQIWDFIEQLLEKTKDMSQGELIRFIFLNNLQSSFIGMIFGIGLGIFSVFATISNGYLLGFVMAESVKGYGISVLWRLLPHGIFELPAIFISLGLGLKLGMFIFEKEKIDSLKKYFWSSLKAFLFIVVPLLIIAGIIEGSLIFLLG